MTCSSGRTRGWEVDKEDGLGFFAQGWCGAVGMGLRNLHGGVRMASQLFIKPGKMKQELMWVCLMTSLEGN